MNSSQFNFDQFSSKMLNFLLGAFEKMWDAIRNSGKWSDMADVKLPEIISSEIKLEKILSIIYFEWELILDGWII